MRARRIDAFTEFDEGGVAPDGRLIDERSDARVGWARRWAPSLRTKVQKKRVRSLRVQSLAHMWRFMVDGARPVGAVSSIKNHAG